MLASKRTPECSGCLSRSFKQFFKSIEKKIVEVFKKKVWNIIFFAFFEVPPHTLCQVQTEAASNSKYFASIHCRRIYEWIK